MIKNSLFAIVLGLILFACSENKTEHVSQTETQEISSESPAVSEAKGTSAIIDAYLEVKDALVNDNSSEAASKSLALVAALKSFDVASSKGEDIEEAERLQVEAALVAENLNSEEIAAQRDSFQTLSVLMKDFIQIAGTDRTLYEQYCPMYKNNTGGVWLSASTDIKNPLFGSAMLTCGSVQDTIAVD